MTTEDEKLKQRMIPFIQGLQDHYMKMSEPQKIACMTRIVESSRNNEDIKRILTIIRKGESNPGFGQNMLIDAAYMLFPDSCAA